MKKLLSVLSILLILVNAQAQDSTSVNVMGKKIVPVSEDSVKTEVSIMNDQINIRDNTQSDTTNIRIGRKNIEIVEDNHKTQININRDDQWKDEWKGKEQQKRFNGHWSGFELGFNGFYDSDYRMYENNEFMELNQPKSMEVNVNFIEYNICMKEDRIGFVTGMGLSINNYKFDNPVTIDRENGIIRSVPLDPGNLEKSKLTVSYLTVPLMLEFQIPVNGYSNLIFISGGLLGGINLGSHTKIKQDHSKSKDHGSFNINPFKYALMARAGLKNISIYGSYSLSPLFKEDKGPELFPFSIGISLINF